jgi:hypothetical protein
MTKRRRADQVKVKAERDEAQQTLGIVSCSSHASSPKHSLSVDASISTRAFGRFPSTAANRSRSLDPPFLENLCVSPDYADLAIHLVHVDAYPLLGWPPCGFTVVSVRDVDMLSRADGGDHGRL